MFSNSNARHQEPGHQERWDWRGSCSSPGMNPDWWDVIGHTISSDNLRAIRICLSCPVKEECWADVLENPVRCHGTIRAARVVAAPETLRRRKRKEREEQAAT